jgi:hypothetical protein
MFNDHSTMDKRRRLFSRAAADHNCNVVPRGFTPQEIASLLYEHPELGLAHDPASRQVIQMLATDTEDRDLQEMFAFIVKNRYQQFIASGDVFWGNYPPRGGIVYPADFIALAIMPTSDPTGLARSQLTGNVAFLGPTKSGKTTLLSILLSYPELLKSTRMIAFVKKYELRHLATVPALRDLILIFRLQELALSYFQPPGGVPEQAWNNESTRLPAQCYARYSAQRLMGEMVNELMAVHPKICTRH